MTILLTVTNGLVRRLLAGNTENYLEFDILIILPLIPTSIYVIRNLDQMRKVPPIWAILLFGIVTLSIPRIMESDFTVIWGILNTPVMILSVLLGLQEHSTESIKFARLLGKFSLLYLLFQALKMPSFDNNWCLNRRPFFLQLMSCKFPDTRLWGTMESPAAMGCFLSIVLCFTLMDIFHGNK